MNHLPASNQLRKQIDRELQELRARGYFGDGKVSPHPSRTTLTSLNKGFWSRGTRLSEGSAARSYRDTPDVLPEFIVRIHPYAFDPFLMVVP
jgi:hypothetical protein